MKNLFTLYAILLLAFGCSTDGDSNDVIVTLEVTGISDGKLAINNSANFTTNVSGFEGDASLLSYRWTLSTNRGELSDGSNSLANPTTGGSSINCVGKTAGEEQISLEVLDASNNIMATESYNFMIIEPDDTVITRGCYDQPKIFYKKGSSLYTSNFDGSDKIYAGVSGVYSTNISPNGEWFALTKYVGNNPSVYTGYLM